VSTIFAPMPGLLVGLLFLRATIVAADLGACANSEGGACEAGDHSLVQIASSTAIRAAVAKKARAASGSSLTAGVHPKHHGGHRKGKHGHHAQKPAAGLVERGQREQRAASASSIVARAASDEEKRTIPNITKSIDIKLSDLELMSELLTFGQHKLCNSEKQDGDRVKTLKEILRVKSLMQTNAVERRGGDYPAADYPTEERALNTTMEGMSEDINSEVLFVEQLMQAIAKRKDKNENVAADIRRRVKDLINLLTMETKECRGNGMYEKPDPAPEQTLWGMASDAIDSVNPFNLAQSGQNAKETVTVSHKDEKAGQAGEQTPTTQLNQEGDVQDVEDGQHADAGQAGEQEADVQDVEDGQQAMAQSKDEKAGQAGEQTPTTQPNQDADVQDVEDGQQAMAQSKDEKVGEADVPENDEGEPLALLAERVVSFRQPIPPALASGRNLTLKIVSTNMDNDVTTLEKDVALLVSEKNRLGVADTKESERLEHMDMDLGLSEGSLPPVMALQTGQATSGAVETEMADHGEDEKSKLGDKIRKAVPYGRQPDGSNPLTSLVNITIANISEGVDAYITSLEKDLDTITKEKHQVCMSTKKFLDRMNAVVDILNTVEC